MEINQHEFTYNDKTYIAVKRNNTCDDCAFQDKDCGLLRRKGKIPSCITKVDEGVMFLIFVKKGNANQ